MTFEKAIPFIEAEQESLVISPKLRAYEKALEAMHMRIPKRVQGVYESPEGIVWACPKCRGRHFGKNKPECCDICGQAVEWDNKEEK